jgi:hypothetical protein
MKLCDERLGDETLINNVECHHLSEVEDNKISTVDGD